MIHKYIVGHKVTVEYSRTVEAETAKEAEAIAADLGDFGADDRAIETEWKVKERL